MMEWPRDEIIASQSAENQEDATLDPDHGPAAPTGGTRGAAPVWTVEMADAVAEVILREVFPDRRDDSAFRGRIARCSQVDIVCVAATVTGRPVPGRTEGDASAAGFGRWLAELGYGSDVLKDTYWVRMRQILDEWADRSWHGLAPDGGPLPPELIGEVSTATFDRTKRELREAVEAHEAAAATSAAATSAAARSDASPSAAATSREGVDERRRAWVTRLLGDDWRAVETRPAELALGYRLEGTHVALLVEASDRRLVDSALSRARTAARARDSLVVPLEEARWAAWLGFGGHPSADMVPLLEGAMRASGLRTSTGRPHEGLRGFRRSHSEARRATELLGRLARNEAWVAFRDVALESLLLHDADAAAAFAADELGDLAEDTPRAARIRVTLRAWLSRGSRAEAALHLGVHENTVRQRLNAAAKALGPRYLDRRVELLLALRIHEAAFTSGSGSADGTPSRARGGRTSAPHA